ALLGEKPDVWDSGKVDSEQSHFVHYAGPMLTSRQRCYWTVRTWDGDGQASDWAAPAVFEMGLLDSCDWQAIWIGSETCGDEKTYPPAPMLRKTFELSSKPNQARLYITALGLYDCSINGQAVTNDLLRPGWTDYNKRLIYQVYDVTALLNQGDNVIGSMLGDGWYAGRVGWPQSRQTYGKQPQLLAQLEITDSDGAKTIVNTDGSWKTADGPIRSNDLQMGEDFDANFQQPGWDNTSFDDTHWDDVKLMEAPTIPLVAVRGPAVRQTQQLKPIADPIEIEKGKYIFDLGQNMVGWCHFQLAGQAGQTVTFRYAEILKPDGTMYVENLRSARAIDTYTFARDGVCDWQPRFTFHGFRYVEISGLDQAPSRDAVTGVVIHSDTPKSGEFTCSNELVNQLQSNITWGQRGNFLEVPTDCPQRDERLGWTGDAQVFIRTAAFNMDVAGFFNKWFDDMVDAQTDKGTIPAVIPNLCLPIKDDGEGPGFDGGPAWADAAVICPWTIYQCYGDTDLIVERYDMLKRFVDAMHDRSHELIRCDPRYTTETCFGDWLNHNAVTSNDLIGTAFMAYCTNLFAQMAKAIGKEEDAQHYAHMFEQIRDAFCHHFVTPAGRLANQTQTAYLLALHFDLLPEDQRQFAADRLAADFKHRGTHLSTGFVGSPYINHVLTRFGYLDLAYDLLNQDTFPSWLYPVTQGATTIWERWDSWHHERGFQSVGMNSFNHYAYGAIGAWLYQTVAGIEIDPEKPGYKHILIAPKPGGGLTHAKGKIDSVYGAIVSQWQIDDAGVFTLDITIPANTTATVTLPDGQQHKVGSGQYQWSVGELVNA
ncbi:MAG: family 78 glycoside hydrolase catalytic domain, partial [Phycisphaeraceae bacterium JB051]